MQEITEPMRSIIKHRENYDIHFRKLWVIFPVPRSVKELLKRLFFGIFPFVFNRCKAYQHWKSAGVFAGNKDKILYVQYWRNLIRGFYDVKIELNRENNNSLKPGIKLAIVIHVFYLDVFKDIISYLLKSDYQDFKLFVTHTDNLEKPVNDLLLSTQLDYQTLIVENKGRDVLPFLKIIPDVIKEDYKLVLKLHTKKSNYLNTKELWSHQLFSELIGNDQLINNVTLFGMYDDIGMLAPFGHIVPLSLYYGANAERLVHFAEKLGFAKDELNDMVFVAGTMFYARKEVLEILIKLYTDDGEFEPEEFQIDGTLAHVMERAFALGLNASRLTLADSHSNAERISCRVVLNHPFVI